LGPASSFSLVSYRSRPLLSPFLTFALCITQIFVTSARCASSRSQSRENARFTAPTARKIGLAEIKHSLYPSRLNSRRLCPERITCEINCQACTYFRLLSNGSFASRIVSRGFGIPISEWRRRFRFASFDISARRSYLREFEFTRQISEWYREDCRSNQSRRIRRGGEEDRSRSCCLLAKLYYSDAISHAFVTKRVGDISFLSRLLPPSPILIRVFQRAAPWRETNS